MYECVSEVLLHLGRMFGIVFTAQTAQIWPKKNLFAALFHFPMKVLEHGLLNMPLAKKYSTDFRSWIVLQLLPVPAYC